ncbi:MAG TPA: hypothetical protein VM554_13190 [Acidisarcina sp.]|nr:hypothetical protein [Acidisarcina sp.]
MAWTETYHCDVCNKPKKQREDDWWLAWTEEMTPAENMPAQPVLKLTPWNVLLAHGPGVKHLCGARCAQTQMDRFMSHHIS